MLFEDTSRLSQVALAMSIAGGVVTLLGFVGNYTWFGIMLLVLAGLTAATTVVRDRADASVWPAYGALGVVVVGMLMAVPMALAANDTIGITREGKAARDAFLVPRANLDAAVRACTPDTARGCSAAAILATPQARQAGLRADDNCTGAGEICLADASNDQLAWKYVTKPIAGVGSLRIDELRDRRNVVVTTACRPVTIDADTELVKAACGPELTVDPPAVAD